MLPPWKPFLNRSEVKIIAEDLQRIRSDGSPIGVVLDNARIHHARVVKQKAMELDRHLLFLPAYSPTFNPIEFLWIEFFWKDGKKMLAKEADFNQAKQKAQPVFLQLMRQRALSYARSWINCARSWINQFVDYPS